MTTIYVKDGTLLPERAQYDLYATERGLITALLDEVWLPRNPSILDIGAGDDGRWGAMFGRRAQGMEKKVTGVEIRDVVRPPGFDYWYNNTDFLTWDYTGDPFNIIVSNPPYKFAEEIICKAWSMLDLGGHMFFLLRLSFQEGVERYNGLWNELWPYCIYVMSRRPSFYGEGRTNGTAFGIYHWIKGPFGKPMGLPRTWQTKLLLHERD